MAVGDWTTYTAGGAITSVQNTTSAMNGANSFLVTSISTDATAITKHSSQGAVTIGKTRTLFKISSLYGQSKIGVFGMLQSNAATANAYWAYVKLPDLAGTDTSSNTLYLARAAGNALYTTDPLSVGVIPTDLVQNVRYAIELEWQYDSINGKVALFGRFGTNNVPTPYSDLTTVAAYVDTSGSKLTTSVGTGIGIQRKGASGINPNIYFDTTRIIVQ